jgi:hypothetical protein
VDLTTLENNYSSECTVKKVKEGWGIAQRWSACLECGKPLVQSPALKKGKEERKEGRKERRKGERGVEERRERKKGKERMKAS